MNFDLVLNLLAEEDAVLSMAKRSVTAIAVPDCARPWVIASYVRLGGRRPIFIITPTDKQATATHSDLGTILGEEQVELFPAWETLPFERVSPMIEIMGKRAEVIWKVKNSQNPKIIVSPIRAVTQQLAPEHGIEPISMVLKGTIDLQQTLEALIQMGYRRVAQVEQRGEVANRGSILDIYPATATAPIRVDLWGDEIDRLVEFSISDQRTTVLKQHVQIFPARELLPTSDLKLRAEQLITDAPWGRSHWEKFADGEIFDGMESWLPWLTQSQETILDHLPADALVLLTDPSRSRSRVEEISREEDQIGSVLSQTWNIGDAALSKKLHLPLEKVLENKPVSLVSLVSPVVNQNHPEIDAQPWQSGMLTDNPMEKIEQLLKQDYQVVLSVSSDKSRQSLSQIINRHGLNPNETLHEGETHLTTKVQIVVGPITQSVIFPLRKIAVISENDFTGRRKSNHGKKRKGNDAKAFHEDLRVGSYVVHEHHGVALYRGIVSQFIGGVERDYLLLEYRKGDKLYVPTEQINQIRHYTGGSEPALSRMGGVEWHKTKTKVRSEIQKIVHELVSLYQNRLTDDGYAFSSDTPWQQEVEDSFPFQETPDQLLAIQAVKEDMEQRRPMDRLVCGDVGFGKTEIALRAAFKAIQDNKQVAILVPTTLLAQQHFQTFVSRLRPYPMQIEVISRFLTTKESARVIKQLATGEVDLVIGTHRLLSDDIAFRDLGLLIVDEEQRFGVKHKEILKELKTSIDVLTLSATPIPRTLEMSLTGIRDLTILNTPPTDRYPILTFVGEYEESVVVAAVRRELLREGQVFFVHNRVADIERIAENLRSLVPEARIAIAHGQMDERTLEQVVVDFWRGSYDVLVCTTIIESGIDMPTVNTLIVGNADRLGLGQLHQLRGRVGRSSSRAYAYLFTPKGASVGEIAYERLKTIGESTELGSGFKIAMRDLEIRGAGNLLGTGQSGHVAAVGYDLYCQLVTEAVAEYKGQTIEELQDVSIELPVVAQIPLNYISKEDQRLEAYRRLAICEGEEDIIKIETEWADRFGQIPLAAQNLLSVARLRYVCRKLGVTEIAGRKPPTYRDSKWEAKISPIQLRPSEAVKTKRVYTGSVYKEASHELHIVFTQSDKPILDIIEYLQDLKPPLT